MSNVVKVDFGKEKRDAFKLWDEDMARLRRKETRRVLINLAFLAAGIMMLPFIIDYFMGIL